jgi:hypothetical protein
MRKALFTDEQIVRILQEADRVQLQRSLNGMASVRPQFMSGANDLVTWVQTTLNGCET